MRVLDSARHQAALSVPTGYRRWTRVTVSRGGVSSELEPVSGEITQDARREARWDGRMSFVGDDILPRRPEDLLSPFGTQVSVELGIELLDGTISNVACGTYEVVSTRTQTDANQRTVEIGLSDLSTRVDAYRFEDPYTVPAGTDLADMVNSVVMNRTGVSPGLSATGSTLGVARTLGLESSTGPWAELLDILSGFSRTLWYDRDGLIQVGTIDPDPATAYPLDRLTSMNAGFDSRPPNVFVARGEPQGGTAPVQAVVVDDDPSSPTYAGEGPGTSPYGRVTEFFSSPLLTTYGQALSAAETIRARHLGQGATYPLVRPYDPTIDATDVISVSGDIMVVDAVKIDLTGDTTVYARRL